MVENEKGLGKTDDRTTGEEERGSVRASEAYFLQIWEAATDAMALSDPEGIVLDVNPAYLRLYGYTLEQVVGQNFAIVFPEEMREWAVEQYKVVFAGEGTPPPFESTVRRADGSECIVESSATFLTTAGERTAMLSTIRDITAFKLAESAQRSSEEALRRSQERLRLTMESITEYAIITTDLDGYITSWNVGAEEMFGYPAVEILGQHTAIIFTPEDRARGAPAQEMEQARRTGRAADERWHLRKDGTRFFVSGVMTPLRDGAIVGYVKVARDLTERKQMEEAVRQLNASLEAQVETRTQEVRGLVTQLTMSEQAERRRISQILHDDLQQRLYSLNFYLTNLRHALDTGNHTDILQMLAEINEIVDDSIRATRSLSVDLSPPVLHREGLVEAIHWLAMQMAQQHGLIVSVHPADAFTLPDEDLRVLLFQIVRELLFNIVKHAGVKTAQVTLTHEDERIRIDVWDEGRGFDASAPSTQNSQGLLRIQQRLQLLGGHMQIESGLGQGTRVTLYSPMRLRNV
ncbi:MAG: PAS domain S-box protein [Caldilineaceae bacterium]|nr:PAS domain S-box protein [Caldilineaceae bacterium]